MVLMMVIMTWWSRRCFHQSPSSRLLFCVNTLIGAWWGNLGGRTPHLLFITMRTISVPTIEEGLLNYLYDNSGYFISLFNFINSMRHKVQLNSTGKKMILSAFFIFPLCSIETIWKCFEPCCWHQFSSQWRWNWCHIVPKTLTKGKYINCFFVDTIYFHFPHKFSLSFPCFKF